MALRDQFFPRSETFPPKHALSSFTLSRQKTPMGTPKALPFLTGTNQGERVEAEQVGLLQVPRGFWLNRPLPGQKYAGIRVTGRKKFGRVLHWGKMGRGGGDRALEIGWRFVDAHGQWGQKQNRRRPTRRVCTKLTIPSRKPRFPQG